MVNRNIQMKKKNNEEWENLFPLSLNENIYNTEGKNLNDQFDQLNEKINDTMNTITNIYRLNAKNPPNELEAVVGDGKTDDQPALQAMVDYLNGIGGGVIYLPRGVYRLYAEIKWKSNVSLFGEGEGVTILKPYQGQPLTRGFAAIGWEIGSFTYSKPMTNCTFRDFEIDGEDMTFNKYTSYPKGIVIHYLKDCNFLDMTIRNTVATGLGIDFLNNVAIDNVSTFNCGRGWEDNGLEENVGGAGIGIGTRRMDNESFVIRNCVADGNGNYGIFIEDQGHSAPDQNLNHAYSIVNNISKNNRKDGIVAKGGLKVLIANNITYNNENAGIGLVENNGFTIRNVIIEGNITEHNRHGILIDCDGRVEDVKISNNNIRENTFRGIYVTGENTRVGNLVMNGNMIIENYTGLTIDLKLDSELITIMNNQIFGNENSGLVLNSNEKYMRSVFIENNQIWNNNTANNIDEISRASGLYIEVIGNDFTIKNNDIRNTSSATKYPRHQLYGVQFADVSNLTRLLLINNTVMENINSNFRLPVDMVTKTINGNFLNGENAWEYTGFTGDNLSINEGVAQFTPQSTDRELLQKFPNDQSIIDHEYYVVSSFLANSSEVVLKLGTTEVGHSGNNAYQKVSLKHRATGTSHVYSIRDKRTTSWGTTQVQYCYVVDLTELFGYGNEPSLKWCDDNIRIINP